VLLEREAGGQVIGGALQAGAQAAPGEVLLTPRGQRGRQRTGRVDDPQVVASAPAASTTRRSLAPGASCSRSASSISSMMPSSSW
jgi:hypothetical protein